MSVTLDASTALAAVLPGENSEFARAALAAGMRDGLVMPALWPYEVQNGLGHELRLAERCLLSAYDAAHLGVARATGSKLATNDERLRHAAQTVGVVLI